MDTLSLDPRPRAGIPPLDGDQHGGASAEAAPEPRGAHWTPERIAQLKELWGQGLSLSEIARTIGNLTRNQVVGKVHRLALPGRPSPLLPSARDWYRKARTAPLGEREPFPVSALLDLPGARLVLGLPPLPAPEPEAAPEAEAPEPVPAAVAAGTGPAPAARRDRPRAEAGKARDGARAAQPRRAESVMELPFQSREPALGVSAAVQALVSGACKWPIGDPRDADFHFCCAPRKGKAYCDEHARLAYTEPQGRVRAARAA